MKTSTSLFAKALATENIHVSFDSSAKTATFDVSSRTLIIPDWKVSDSVRDMIVAHEVAHALHTPAKGLLDAMDSARIRKLDPNGYKACINVIEDARIERLIKEKFPGCRRDFYAGYKELHDIDLFQIRHINPEQFTIIDKINLHFKFGLFGLMQFDFTASEQRLMERIREVKTFDEVVELADELYALEAEDEKNRGVGRASPGNQGANGDLGDALNKLERDGNREKLEGGRGQATFAEFPHMSYPLPGANSTFGIIPFTDILEEDQYILSNMSARLTSCGDADHIPTYNKAISKVSEGLEEYRASCKDTVRELVAQFERRKAAEEYRNERQKPTGNINPDRLHQFKTHDDIFLRNLIRYEGKKHGMVMLIDWSGSMRDCLDGVIRQVLLLTWFCRKAKIPYEVFFYTELSGFEKPQLKAKHSVHCLDTRLKGLYGDSYYSTIRNTSDYLHLSDVAVRQIFSSSMNDQQFKAMEQMLWRMVARDDGGNYDSYQRSMLSMSISSVMSMHGTPSCEALLVMHDFIPKFRAATGTQILDFIFVTDGEPGGMSRSGKAQYLPVRSIRVQYLRTGRTLQVESDDQRRGRVDHLQLQTQYFLVDEIRRLGCVTVGFSIGGMSSIGHYLMNRIVRNPKTLTMKPIDAEASVKPYESFYKKENFIPSDPENTPGFDEYYVIRPVKPLGSEELDNGMNSQNATLTRIRNQFIKSLNSRKCSRVFLSRFIDLISGRKVKKFRIMG